MYKIYVQNTCEHMYRIHNEMKKYIIIYNFKKVYFIIEKLKDHIKTLKNLIIINLQELGIRYYKIIKVNKTI